MGHRTPRRWARPPRSPKLGPSRALRHAAYGHEDVESRGQRANPPARPRVPGSSSTIRGEPGNGSRRRWSVRRRGVGCSLSRSPGEGGRATSRPTLTARTFAAVVSREHDFDPAQSGWTHQRSSSPLETAVARAAAKDHLEKTMVEACTEASAARLIPPWRGQSRSWKDTAPDPPCELQP